MAQGNTIGMPAPGASSLMPSPADQVQNETEEQRKKRMQALEASRSQPGMSAVLGSGYGAALGG
jgi:hypothetical protein